ADVHRRRGSGLPATASAGLLRGGTRTEVSGGAARAGDRPAARGERDRPGGEGEPSTGAVYAATDADRGGWRSRAPSRGAGDAVGNTAHYPVNGSAFHPSHVATWSGTG